MAKARERLEALGDRLERAFGRVREALERQRQAQADPLEEARRRLAAKDRAPTPEPRQDRTRRLFEDYTRGRQLRGPGWE